MSTGNQQDRIADVLEECTGFWAISNIPPGKVEDMRGELEQHLREAETDGKPVEAVVGDEVIIFAHEWARENGPRMSLARELLDCIYALLIATTGIMVAHHALSWSISFNVYWHTLVLIFLPAVGASLMLSPRLIKKFALVSPRWKRELIGFATLTLLLGVPVMLAVLIGRKIDAPIFEWTWIGTVVVALTCAAIFFWRDDSAMPIYEDEDNQERIELDRGFVFLALVIPLGTLAALVATSLTPQLTFFAWWSIPGLFVVLFPPKNATRWRNIGLVMLVLSVVLTSFMYVSS